MARYTITLRELTSSLGYDEMIKVFSDYELSDYLTSAEIETINNRGCWSKEQLAKRILNHFWLKEIGFNNAGEFIHNAKDMLAELMESYLPLIYSASIKYDPLVNVDFTEEFTRTNDVDGKANVSNKSNGNGLEVRSDTPMTQVNKSEILQGKYASETSASEGEQNESSENVSSSSENEHYTKTTKGNSGVSATAQKMIEQYRQNIRAINTEIVYALSPLFMGIF